MQPKATKQGTSRTASADALTPYVKNVLSSKIHRPQFKRAEDGRKQPIRGLWVATASGKFYGQLTVEEPDGKKRVRGVPLLDKDTKQPILTLAKAKEALARLKTNRADGELPVLTRTPKFADFVMTYLSFIKAGEAAKAKGTIGKGESQLKKWVGHMGDLRLRQIRQSHMNSFMQKRLGAGISQRTFSLDVIALRNVLNHAINEGWIRELPLPRARRNPSRQGKSSEPKHQLLTPADVEVLCDAAMASGEDGSPVTKNGRQFCDYIRFMAYSGTRRNEALGVRWSNVDLDGGVLRVARQVTHRGIEDLKNGEPRQVNFNAKLEALLREMHSRRAPDTDGIFPSPQRGKKDIPAKSFQESLKQTRRHAAKKQPKLAGVGSRDLRHHFISSCVMSGIDFMTIASWVGHQDGGVLIGKVYGHLADQHKRPMAQRVNFGPVIVEQQEAAL